MKYKIMLSTIQNENMIKRTLMKYKHKESNEKIRLIQVISGQRMNEQINKMVNICSTFRELM